MSRCRWFVAGSAMAVALQMACVSAEAPSDRRLGLVMTHLFWSVYQTDDASEECPEGFNDGPREQFAALYPQYELLSVETTQLRQEVATWLPSKAPDGFLFKEASGPFSWGIDLDGAVGDEDYTHPDGTPGIDNQVYRAVGCIIGFRGPDGVEYVFQDKAIADETYNRMMLEVTEVDDLVNDDQVSISLYRGLDRLLTDATGEKIVPGGSQRVDYRWGRSLIRHTTGRIADGVLITEPMDDMVMPWMNLNVSSIHRFFDLRFQLRLTPDGAEGLMAGYADVDTWYYQLIRNDSTHHLSNGQISGISLYKALHRLADAYPDPETGEFTAISTALDVKMVRVNVLHDAR